MDALLAWKGDKRAMSMGVAGGRADGRGVAGARVWRRIAVACRAVFVFATIAVATPANSSAEALKAMWGPAVHDGTSLFPTYRELGVKIYEDRLHWSLIAPRRPHSATNPNDPAYVWPAEVTQAVAEAKRYHMQVALQIIGAPPWANGGKPWNWAPTQSSGLRELRDRRGQALPVRASVDDLG